MFESFKGKVLQIRKKVEEFKGNHKMASQAISAAIDSMPDPFNKFFSVIWNGLEKEGEDGATKLLEILEKIESTEQSFDEVKASISQLIQFAAKKEDIQKLGEQIRISNDSIVDILRRSSEEILKEVRDVKQITSVTRARVERIEILLEKRQATHTEIKRPPKPSIFRGESTKIFVGRKQDIDTIRNYFAESNLPVSITGEGGIGKSELAYKAMHKCEDMFDLIIPIYSGSHLTFESFLLEMVKSLNLPIEEFEKKGLEDRRDEIINALGQQFKHPLIYADNYETIAGVLTINDGSASPSSEGEGEDNARKINAFLEGLPPNTGILLTSRERYNLDCERPVRLDGLSETEGRDLFIELARNHFPRAKEASQEIKRALEELSKKTGGHPLSIELLARSYRAEGLSKIMEMVGHMGVGVMNPKEETERLQSLESCFEYSFNRIPQIHRDLLPKLIFFNSPFPADAAEKVFDFEGSSNILKDLYARSLLRKIEFDEYGDDDNSADGIYVTYYFHPAIRNYLDHILVGEQNKRELEEKYGDQFSLYYYKLVQETYDAIGTKNHVLSLERFNVINFSQGKDNDFNRAVRLAKDRSVASSISSYLGLILYTLGIYREALRFHNKALALHEELQDRVGMASDYKNIGIVLDRQGNYDQALQFHNKALKIEEELQDRVGMAGDYGNIGNVLQSQGNYDQALQFHNKALALHEVLQDRVRMAGDYTNIGIVLGSQGNYDQALEHFKKALKIEEELQDRVGMASDYKNIGIVYSKKSCKAEAIESHFKGLEILEELEQKTGYHHPLSDRIQRHISELQEKKGG